MEQYRDWPGRGAALQQLIALEAIQRKFEVQGAITMKKDQENRDAQAIVANAADSNSPNVDATRTSYDSPAATSDPSVLACGYFGSLRLLRLLGEGGMGSVYEAEDPDTSRIIALKLPHASGLDRERLLQEAQVAASISHPNCVFVFGSVESNGNLAIAMELVKGTTAKQIVEDNGQLSVDDAIHYTLDILAGLEAAHEKGILHRDIKPANIFIDAATGMAKVGDFGLSVSRPAPGATNSASFAGTPAYASPEQLQGLPLDLRSDIYSVGATLYYLLTARPPFIEADMIQLVASIAARVPDPPSKFNAKVPAEIDAVVLRALAKRPEDRFQDYSPFRAAITPDMPAPIMRRIAAGMLDNAAFMIPVVAVVSKGSGEMSPGVSILTTAFQVILHTGLGLMEGKWGVSPGKWVCGLRVRRRLTAPGWRPGLIRGFSFALLRLVPEMLLELTEGLALGWTAGKVSLLGPWGIASTVASLIGQVLPFLSARKSNGWAGLHDQWSRSRVTLKRSIASRGTSESSDLNVPADARRLGPFLIDPAPDKAVPTGMSQGWDPQLRRAVWIVEHASGKPSLPMARKDDQRRSRLRWITGERKSGQAWDAYEAPAGEPLTSLSKPVSISELASALADLALDADPAALAPDKVWISNGRGIFCDIADSPPAAVLPKDQFFSASAQLALKGESGVPLPVGEILSDLESGRLSGQEAHDLLKGIVGGDCTVSRGRRLQQLAVANIFLLLTSAGFMAAAVAAGKHLSLSADLASVLPVFITLQFAVGMAIASFTGSHLSYSLCGLSLTTPKGARAPRWRLILRTAIPLVFGLALLLGKNGPKHPGIIALYWAVILPGVISAIWRPSRGLLDRLTGVWVSRA